MPPRAGSNSATVTGVATYLTPGASGTTPDKKSEWVLYDGYLLAGGPSISWRHNNPGSIHYGPFAKRHGCFVNADTSTLELAIFPSPETGWSALVALIQSKSGMTLYELFQSWTFKGNKDEGWMKAVISSCKKQGLVLTRDTVLDTATWDPQRLDILGQGIARAEGFYREGRTYRYGQARVPSWVRDIFDQTYEAPFDVEISPSMEMNARVPCCDKRDEGDPPHITFVLKTLRVDTQGKRKPYAIDFPHDGELSFWIQELPTTATIRLVRTGTGTYAARIWATVCESGNFNVHTDLTVNEQGAGGNKSYFEVKCDE